MCVYLGKGAVRFPQDFFLQEFSCKATPENSCQVLPKILSLARLSVRLTQDITRILEKSCVPCENRTALKKQWSPLDSNVSIAANCNRPCFFFKSFLFQNQHNFSKTCNIFQNNSKTWKRRGNHRDRCDVTSVKMAVFLAVIWFSCSWSFYSPTDTIQNLFSQLVEVLKSCSFLQCGNTQILFWNFLHIVKSCGFPVVRNTLRWSLHPFVWETEIVGFFSEVSSCQAGIWTKHLAWTILDSGQSQASKTGTTSVFWWNIVVHVWNLLQSELPCEGTKIPQKFFCLSLPGGQATVGNLLDESFGCVLWLGIVPFFPKILFTTQCSNCRKWHFRFRRTRAAWSTQARIQDFGQGGPAEFWPQWGAWAQNFLKIGFFSLSIAWKLPPGPSPCICYWYPLRHTHVEFFRVQVASQ